MHWCYILLMLSFWLMTHLWLTWVKEGAVACIPDGSGTANANTVPVSYPVSGNLYVWSSPRKAVILACRFRSGGGYMGLHLIPHTPLAEQLSSTISTFLSRLQNAILVYCMCVLDWGSWLLLHSLMLVSSFSECNRNKYLRISWTKHFL